MNRFFKLTTASFLVFYGLTACQTTQNHQSERDAASVLETDAEFDARFDAAFIEELKNGGASLFSPVNSTSYPATELNKMLMSEHIEQALRLEFSIVDEYNKASDQTYRDCLEGRKQNPDYSCESIMDTDVYKKSMAVWMYSDYARGMAQKAFKRLSSLGENSSDISDDMSKISYRSGKGLNEVQNFARAYKASFESSLRQTLLQGAANVINARGNLEYRRGARNTLAFAAQTELAALINEVEEEAGNAPIIKVDLENLYERHARSYRKEALTGKVQPQELEAFIDVIEQLTPSRVEREIASIGWHDVHGRTFKQGEFALTYDDGPKKSTTSKLLAYLGSNEVRSMLGYTPHATFFWQAQNASRESNAGILREAKRLGYGLSSHSYSHQDFRRFVRTGRLVNKTTNKKGVGISFKRELVEAKRVLEKVYGTQLNYFRLPYAAGRGNRILQEQIGANNMVHIFWNINADDWKWRSMSKSLITRNYIREIDKAGRGVILLHDIHENTVGPLTKALITHFAHNRDKYRIVPLEDGIQETFINIPANGRLPSQITRIAPSKISSGGNKSVTETVFPHFREIQVGILNVRSGPNSSARKCGRVFQNDVTKIMAQNSWFAIDTFSTPPRALDGEAQHTCGSQAYISNGSKYSKKVQ